MSFEIDKILGLCRIYIIFSKKIIFHRSFCRFWTLLKVPVVHIWIKIPLNTPYSLILLLVLESS